MSRGVQSVIEELSAEAQALIHRMLDQNELPDDVARAVFRLSGERVSRAAITYYAFRYAERRREHRTARAETDDFIRLAGKQGVKISELLRAAVIEKLILTRRNGKFNKTDLFKLDDAERRRRELELKQKQARQATKHKRREIELKERKMQLDEQRLKLGQALDRLEDKASSGELTQEDVRRFREMYGLYDDEKKSEDGSPESE